MRPASERAAEPAAREPGRPAHEVFGIRHHGPGSSRSLLRALAGMAPDAVLVEGPSDADPLLADRGTVSGLVPPVALLAHVEQDPARAAFWPLADFSPEWQAITWAHAAGVPVAFCDLPAAVVLARPAPRATATRAPDAAATIARPRDPLAGLAEAAGYDDPERWWDDVVESRLDGASPFAAVSEAMAALREDQPAAGDDAEAVREAWMRQVLRRTWRTGARRVAVICGAWHAPALGAPLPPASADTRLLRGLPRTRVRLTWVPWAHSRLASASGYGAGVTSPGWYQHLWEAPDQPVTRWLTGVAHALRERDLAVSTAHVIDAVRLADTLATLRGRPLAGLAEVEDATRAVLCEGDERLVRFVTDDLVVGERLGGVPDGVPTVPLEADLARACRSLRLRREPTGRTLDLDLRRPMDLERSRLFHRLSLLDLAWATPARSAVRGTGSFRETWRLAWRPELAVPVVEASRWGTTVASAAEAAVLDVAARADLPVLTGTLRRCLDADLPMGSAALLEALVGRATLDTDVVHLMEVLPSLARAQRYGDVRRTDVSMLTRVAASMLLRVCAALPTALAGLDRDGAVALRERVDGVHEAVALLALGEERLPAATRAREQWLGTLADAADRDDVPGLLLGRLVRMLRDAGRIDDVPARLGRALSYGAPAEQKAGWVEGFFGDGALLLAHDRVLLGLLDDWVLSLPEPQFVDVLPLLRRTFGGYLPAERRAVATAVRRLGSEPVVTTDPAGPDVDDERGRAAVATVATLLGTPR